jgi:hypothetical protein
MQIIGSPRRLSLDIAVFAILAACIRIFPDASLKSALVVTQFVPTLACCAFFTYLSNRRMRALLLVAGGAFLGWLLCPTVWFNYEDPNWWDDYLHYYRLWPVYSGIGAFVAGVSMYAVGFAASRVRRSRHF